MVEDLALRLATGVDIPIVECQITLHQPSIKEIGMFGESKYFLAMQCLCINKMMEMDSQDEQYKDVTNFQMFMTLLHDKKTAEQRDIVLDALSLLFPRYKIQVTPRALMFNFEKDNSIIDENNFSSLQEILRQISCLSDGAEGEFNPANEAAAEIARKLQRGRERVAAQKQQANGGKSSVFSQYLSILAVGLHIPLQNLLSMTVFQLYDLVERYTLYIDWDLYIRSRLAGGQPDNQPENWMKIIH